MPGLLPGGAFVTAPDLIKESPMPRWNGPAHCGATKELRERKRQEAAERNLRTIFERTRRFRRPVAGLADPRLGR